MKYDESLLVPAAVTAGRQTHSTLAASGVGACAAKCVALCLVMNAATIAASRSAVLYSHTGNGHCTFRFVNIVSNLYLDQK